MVPNSLRFEIDLLISENGNLLKVGKTDVNWNGESHSKLHEILTLGKVGKRDYRRKKKAKWTRYIFEFLTRESKDEICMNT